MVLQTSESYIIDCRYNEYIKKMTANKVLDMLEAELERVHTWRLEYARACVSGDKYYDSISMQRLNEEEAVLKKLWEFVNADDADEYYYNPCSAGIDNKLLKLCNVTVLYAAPSDEPHIKVNKVHVNDFVSLKILLHLKDEDVIATDNYDLTDVVNKQFEPDLYRVFKCKDCGREAVAKISQDDWMRKKGFEPIKRCAFCREFKKYKRKFDIR